ncbi:class I SAM-dependent methyltransferase [Patescibacteria group bacterium]|nr:class I SAM-dependent methyltransferase [Patescibacteria group bacterium]
MKKRKRAEKQTLHLGCGMSKIPGSTGVDINPESAADITHDLNTFPYPFRDNQFERIVAENILEHLDDIPKVIEEIHRIAKHGAKIIISMGHFSSVDSFTDPTHKHFFTSRTFDYFIPGTDLYKYHYSKATFKKHNVWVGPRNPTNPLLKLMLTLINKYLIFYEKRFAFIFPVGVITFDLEVIKEK